ncbi:MAG TPA: alpha/beta hydrolase, partial [Rhizomicrobium sp.]
DASAAKAKVTALLEANAVPANTADTVAATVTSPWLRFFMSYDPVPTLRQVRCPVLAIDGSLDLQVPPEEDLAAIKAALSANPDVTVKKLPGLNHLFQTAKTGAPNEYGEIEETIAPAALAVIGDWIVERTR